jgi:hypothetical protein
LLDGRGVRCRLRPVRRGVPVYGRWLVAGVRPGKPKARSAAAPTMALARQQPGKRAAS